MPNTLQHIDHIARAKNRDVLYVTFHRTLRANVAWETLPERRQIIAWLDQHGYRWYPCGDVASTTFSGRYLGQIYLDVAYDEAAPEFRKLCRFLEKPDGTMAFDGTVFTLLTLRRAMENVEHDAPGFWDEVAEAW
jgi:hypothetical protein